MTGPADITKLLTAAGASDARVADHLLPQVYDQIRDIARAYLARERPNHTLRATELVHEAYIKLVDLDRVDWRGKTHFRAMAAEAMWRLLVDHARARGRKRRGGGWQRVSLDDVFVQETDQAVDTSDLYEALEAMRTLDERMHRVVVLRTFAALENDQIAEVLGVSRRTVERDWTMGRAWLRRELKKADRDRGS